jgi:secreted trypsin-like serine protease
VAVRNGRPVLVGVTSFGPPFYCARKGLPAIFGRVSRYQTFISNRVPGLI